jgi:hypothetical protein
MAEQIPTREEVIEECRRQIWHRIRFAHGSEGTHVERVKGIVDIALNDLKLFPYEVVDYLRMEMPTNMVRIDEDGIHLPPPR